MKRLLGIILLVIVFSATTAFYSAARAEDSFCEVTASLAGTVMQKRQEGFPISQILEIVKAGSSESRELNVAIVKDAYSQPLYQTIEYKQQAITEFETKIYLSCEENY